MRLLSMVYLILRFALAHMQGEWGAKCLLCRICRATFYFSVIHEKL